MNFRNPWEYELPPDTAVAVKLTPVTFAPLTTGLEVVGEKLKPDSEGVRTYVPFTRLGME